MTVASELLALIPEVSTALDDRSPDVPDIIRGTGHLPEMRVDPIGLLRPAARGMRRRRHLRPGRASDVVLLTGGGAGGVLPRVGRGARPGRRLPVHDADLREGRGLRRLPRQRKQICAPSRCAGLMSGHAATIQRRSSGWSPLGDEGEIDLLDWFAELTIYTDVVLPDRPALSRRARLAVRPLTTTSNAARTPSPSSTRTRRSRVRPPRPRPARAGRPGAGDHRPPRPAAGAARGARPARRADDAARRGRRRCFTADEITGMFISMMFAGHHTTPGPRRGP